MGNIIFLDTKVLILTFSRYFFYRFSFLIAFLLHLILMTDLHIYVYPYWPNDLF